ncbi:uncharacterized protein LOC124110416 [Haliotis rufescens]|uniref:uncharacterized protein LOC124110416 n=1 Tax=Haliotis rufescens TaxID=6454 RepID=UPI001EB00C8C|nr:uncharacterized protein LOC124110416 [Haliotis rufescens]
MEHSGPSAEIRDYLVRRWHDDGQKVVKLIEEYIEALKQMSKNNANKRQMASGLGIFGSGLTLLGLALAPFTAGASAAAVAVVGSGVATVGGIAYTGVNIFEKKNENSRAKEIRSRVMNFSDETISLIRRMRTNKTPDDDGLCGLLSSRKTNYIGEFIPFAEPTVASCATGAFSKTFKKNPPTSYFARDEKAIEEVFGYKMSSTHFNGMIGVVGALASVHSIFKHYEQIIDDQRIIDEGTNSAFVTQLSKQKENIQCQLNRGLMRIEQ